VKPLVGPVPGLVRVDGLWEGCCPPITNVELSGEFVPCLKVEDEVPELESLLELPEEP